MILESFKEIASMTSDGQQFDLFGGGAPARPAERAGPRAELYLALLPTEDLRLQIDGVMEKQLARLIPGSTIVAPARWHATLFALGDGGVPPADLVSSAQALAGTVRESAFDIEFDRIRFYAASGAIVLANDSKASMASQFNARLFHHFKFAGLRPYGRSAEHITLMYQALGALPDIRLQRPLGWRVDSFSLVHSTRKSYDSLAEWRLGTS
jgi:2'-5' RNA ligase